jgi:hypothetical protein
MGAATNYSGRDQNNVPLLAAKDMVVRLRGALLAVHASIHGFRQAVDEEEKTKDLFLASSRPSASRGETGSASVLRSQVYRGYCSRLVITI